MIKKYILKDTVRYLSFPFKIYKTIVEENFDVHTHDFAELVIILGGTATHIVDKKEYSISTGDIFLINGDIAHGFKDADNLILCNIEYYPDRFITLTDSLKRMAGFQALFILEPFYRQNHHSRYKLKLENVSLEPVKEILEVMLREYDCRGDGYELVIHSHFIELVVYLSRQYSEKDMGESSPLLRLAEVLAYIESSFLEPLKLEELAARASLSTRQFIRVFKQNYHRTPMDYILHLRLEYAFRLLSNLDMSVTDIALVSGFSDSNYFIRQFRKVYGITPGACRKTLETKAGRTGT